MEATVVDGKFLYRDGRYLTLDLEDTIREAEKLCSGVMLRAGIKDCEF